MRLKIKPLMLGTALLVSATLSGCGSDQSQPEVTDVFQDVGLWCKSPDVIEIASADFYPLSAAEIVDVNAAIALAKTEAEAAAGDLWDATEWEENFKPDSLDLYSILGLTIEETARQVIAKAEARAFKVSQGQDTVFGDEFDTWFDTWFAAIPPASYLGASQRINKSVNSTTAENDGEEICYTPALSCPNYKVIDESGNYDCVVPEQNPLIAPAPDKVAGAGEAVAFYRHTDHVEGNDNTALYADMVIHTWNNDDCTAYADDSISPQWGVTGADLAGIDTNYGAYWIVNLVDSPSNCANIIFNDTATGKKISDSDLVMPLGPSGNVALHNLNKNAYAHDDYPVNVLDGLLIINQHPFFGAEASSGLKACGWGMVADESGEQCLGEELVCPAENVAVGIGAVDIASKCVALLNPAETDLLIRGGFNGWGDAADPNFDASQLAYVTDGQYRVNFPYTTDCVIVAPVAATDNTAAIEGEECVSTYDFKIADINWSEPSTFGSIKGGSQSAVGSTITMTVGEGVGQNMKVDMAKDKIYQFLVNASDVTAVELTINEVPVNAFPMLTIGTKTIALGYAANGKYVTRVDLANETYSFTITDPTTTFAVGAIGTDNVIVESTSLALENGGGALSFTSTAAEYDFILDMSDPAAPTIEIKPALPFGSNAVFIRGSVNGWGNPAEDEVNWNGDSRSYSVIYGLEADGNHAFKFADANWGPVNLGYGDVAISTDADAIEVTDDGGNMRVSVVKATSYKFEISYATADPVVKVSEAPLYLRGGVTGTGWGADDGNQLGFIAIDTANSAEASHTYSLEVNYGGGAAEFKVADAGWGGDYGYNYGSDTPITLGVPLSLDNNGNNIAIDVVAGTYIFAFEDGVTKTMTVTAKP